MSPRTPYQGVYDRVILPPVIVLGLGRMGARVCDAFFQHLDSTLAPRMRGVSGEGQVDLKSLMGRAAVVRSMDENALPLSWVEPRYRYCWDPKFDIDSAERFSMDLPLHDLSFWHTPAAVFSIDAPEFLEQIAHDCTQLMTTLSNDHWADKRSSLGLRPLGDLSMYGRWVIAVGSLCEPDVAAIVPHLPKWSSSLVGSDAGCTSLAFLDCGLPDSPEARGVTWKQCPAPLVAQLSSHIQSGAPESLSFFLTSTRRSKYDATEALRRQTMAGMLKTYLLSTLFQPRSGSDSARSIFTKRQSAISHRASMYVEVTLDTDNLPELMAREALAQWKRRLAADRNSDALEDLREKLDRFERFEDRPFLVSLIQGCCGIALSAGTAHSIRSLADHVSERRRRAAEELEQARHLSVGLQKPIETPAAGFLGRLWALFRDRSTGPRQALAGPSTANVLENLISNYTTALSHLERLAAFADSLLEPEGDFQDRTGDHHFDKSGEANQTRIRYRRVPLDSCPDYLRKSIEGLIPRVDEIVLEALPGSSETLHESTKFRLESYAKAALAIHAKADDKWENDGIIAWMTADAALTEYVAEFVCSGLVPLWRFLPQRNANWKGFLTVLDYGGRGKDEKPHDATRNGIGKLLSSMKQAYARMDSWGSLATNWELNTALVTSEIHFEAWPFYRRLGVLWTEHPVDGYGFGADIDLTSFADRVADWRAEKPEESRWVPVVAQQIDRGDE